MTDLLLKPDDTGDIPTAVGEETVHLTGERTQNLAPYVSGLGPALRRPTAVRALVEDRTALTPPGQPAPPRPLPSPKPRQNAEVVWAEAEPPPYTGRHRRPSRWDWLTVPLTLAVQRVRRSM